MNLVLEIQEEKENLKQVIHNQTLSQIKELGTSNQEDTRRLHENMYRLAQIENERYKRK